jgi:hypothetical protein
MELIHSALFLISNQIFILSYSFMCVDNVTFLICINVLYIKLRKINSFVCVLSLEGTKNWQKMASRKQILKCFPSPSCRYDHHVSNLSPRRRASTCLSPFRGSAADRIRLPRVPHVRNI